MIVHQALRNSVQAVYALNLTGIARNNYDLPVSYQYSLGVQRSLGANSVFSVAYVGNQNRHQNDWREINLPAQSVLPSLVASGGAGYNQDVPFLGFRSLRLAQNEAIQRLNRTLPLRSLETKMSFGYATQHDSSTARKMLRRQRMKW